MVEWSPVGDGGETGGSGWQRDQLGRCCQGEGGLFGWRTRAGEVAGVKEVAEL